MRSLRSIGIFLIALSLLCGLIAFEVYQRAERTARAVADTLEGVEFVAVGIPNETRVAAFIGTVLLVAGGCCLWNSIFGKSPDENSKDGL